MERVVQCVDGLFEMFFFSHFPSDELGSHEVDEELGFEVSSRSHEDVPDPDFFGVGFFVVLNLLTDSWTGSCQKPERELQIILEALVRRVDDRNGLLFEKVSQAQKDLAVPNRNVGFGLGSVDNCEAPGWIGLFPIGVVVAGLAAESSHLLEYLPMILRFELLMTNLFRNESKSLLI